MRVKRLSHATLETPDLERQLAYYTEIFGLSVGEREPDRAILTTREGRHAIELQRGTAPRCTKVAFQVSPEDDFVQIRKELADEGIDSELRNDATPGIDQVLVFEDAKGTTLEVYREARLLREDTSPASFAPRKLGHIAYNVLDVHRTVAFYERVLGFKVSDWRSDFFVFMRCGRDHHTVNFWTHPDKVKMHHMAFELRDWAEMLRACDYLAKNNYHLIWGPGRHVIGHNIFTYHRNPDGHMLELYTEMDQIEDEALGYFEPRSWHQDRPQKPKVWPVETLGNYWGGMVPVGFGD